MDDEVRFLEGDCHILAITLNKITDGFLQIAVTVPDYHAFCLNPQNNYALDFDGYVPVEKLLYNWNTEEFNVVTEEYFIKNRWSMPEFRNSFRRANEIAPSILRRHNIV